VDGKNLSDKSRHLSFHTITAKQGKRYGHGPLVVFPVAFAIVLPYPRFTRKEVAMTHARIRPIHPGEVLLEVYMKPSIPPLTVAELSQRIRVSPRYIQSLIHGHRSITPAMAARLGMIRYTTPDYWLSLQKTYDGELQKRGTARQRKGQISGTIAA
jgi:addiction module HigA family antidote